MFHLRFSTSRGQGQNFGAWPEAALAALLILSLSGAPSVALGQGTGVEALLKRGREAGVDGTQMQMVAKRARRAGLSAGAAASLLRPPVRLAEEGLPAGPLLAKTLEGLAKQVPIGRMRPVLQQHRASVRQAAQVVGPWSPTQKPPAQKKGGAEGKAPGRIISAAAEALRGGTPGEDIESFLNGLPTEARRRASAPQVAAAMAALSDLRDAGSAPEATRQLLTSAIGAGFGTESIRQLPEALQSARRESKRPVGALAEGAARAIARGAPATTVLRGLFPGGVPGGGPPGGPPGTTPGVGKPHAGPPSDPGPPEGPPRGGSAKGGSVTGTHPGPPPR